LTVDLPPAAIVPITPGKGGDVRVHGETVSLTNGARISAQSTFEGAGGASGDVLVVAKNLNVLGAPGIETGISAKSAGAGASGSVQIELLGSSVLDLNAF